MEIDKLKGSLTRLGIPLADYRLLKLLGSTPIRRQLDSVPKPPGRAAGAERAASALSSR